MAQHSHPRELPTAIAREALERVLLTAAREYGQAPLIRAVNDDAAARSEP